MTRPTARSVSRKRQATLSGAGSLSIAGTGRVNRLVNSVLRDNGWARDARNLHGDFERALANASDRANLSR